MLQMLKNALYDLIVWSGIVTFLLNQPTIQKILQKLHGVHNRPSNHFITDDSGHKLKITLWNGRYYPPGFEKEIAGVSKLRIRDDDVLLCGYPKTGCHWMHEILHMLVTQKAELTKNGKGLGGMIDLMQPIIIDSLPSPRVLNSHLLYEELPVEVREKKTKIVFTIRNPKDTVVSYFNHVKNLKGMYDYQGDFNDFFKLFLTGKIEYGSYFDFTLAWDEVMKLQNDNPVLLVKYEDMKSDPVQCVKRVARFLDMKITDEFAAQIVETSHFDNMKTKRKKNFEGPLFRKGVVGDWKNWLTDAQSNAIDLLWQEYMTQCSYQPKY